MERSITAPSPNDIIKPIWVWCRPLPDFMERMLDLVEKLADTPAKWDA
jgi:hypothetical protein